MTGSAGNKEYLSPHTLDSVILELGQELFMQLSSSAC